MTRQQMILALARDEFQSTEKRYAAEGPAPKTFQEAVEKYDSWTDDEILNTYEIVFVNAVWK